VKNLEERFVRNIKLVSVTRTEILEILVKSAEPRYVKSVMREIQKTRNFNSRGTGFGMNDTVFISYISISCVNLAFIKSDLTPMHCQFDL